MTSLRKKGNIKTRSRGTGYRPGSRQCHSNSEDLEAQIGAWARRQADKPLSEAIRRLLERALSSAEPAGPASKTGVRLAEKLASREIEGMVDQSHTKAEQKRRKRPLTHGPKEFRDIRGDQPKRK